MFQIFGGFKNTGKSLVDMGKSLVVVNDSSVP